MSYLIACSVRGDVVHARQADARVALCGQVNVSPQPDEFNARSEWACKRCLQVIQGKPLLPATNKAPYGRCGYCKKPVEPHGTTCVYCDKPYVLPRKGATP